MTQQLTLSLTDLPAAAQAAWEELDPIHREALTQRLALVIAKTLPRAHAGGPSEDE